MNEKLKVKSLESCSFEAIRAALEVRNRLHGCSGHVDECKKCTYYCGDTVNIIAEVLDKHWPRTPEPGTSIVQWVKYDGTPETLPEEERICLLKLQKMVCVGDFQNGYWWVWDNQGQHTNDLPVAIDDLWSYLPQPPEGM